MKLFAADALTPAGWTRDVLIDIDAAGTITSVGTQEPAGDAERARGPLVPGMPNLHSHAFQRAIAGRTGRPSAEGDSLFQIARLLQTKGQQEQALNYYQQSAKRKHSIRDSEGEFAALRRSATDSAREGS